MPDTDLYLASTTGEVISATDLPLGTLAFLSGYAHPVLVTLINNNRCFLHLGGEMAFQIWPDNDDAAALTVPEWRLEIDPKSMTDGYSARASVGAAFRQGTRSGIVGLYADRRALRSYFTVDTDGDSSPLDGPTPRAYFHRWRIVVATPDGDEVLIDDQGKVERY